MLSKGLAKVESIVVETLLQTQMFPSIAVREMLWTQILRLGSKEMFLNQVKNIFASWMQILLLKRMFPSLAPQGNMSGNNVSTTFPSS